MKQQSAKSRYGTLWSRDELILAFDLYCRISFQKTNNRNPLVRELAKFLGRPPSSVARKLGNFGALDPNLRKAGIKGLINASKMDREIWDAFHADWNTLVWEAGRLRKSRSLAADETRIKTPSGDSETLRLTKQRVHQTFFRETILSNYQSTCCVSGLAIPECLNAIHIVPWSDSKEFRTDPTNGLCLSATFHCLFDTGLMTVNKDLTILFAPRVIQHNNSVTRKLLEHYNGRPIKKPLRFLPNQNRLQWHRENKFKA
ncbi:MAG: HNH endonuclease [Gammaproteobacteria bacterium]|nr:HNH endonuclease [Gammaproteobacteria bacterium]